MFRKKFYGTWVERQAYVAMIINSTFLMVLGLWIASPFTNVFEDLQTWHVAKDVFPESVWGALFIFVGFAKLISAFSGMYGLARAAALLAFSLWFVISGTMFIGAGSSPTVIMSSYLAIQAAHHYIMINHKQNLPLESKQDII